MVRFMVMVMVRITYTGFDKNGVNVDNRGIVADHVLYKYYSGGGREFLKHI